MSQNTQEKTTTTTTTTTTVFVISSGVDSNTVVNGVGIDVNVDTDVVRCVTEQQMLILTFFAGCEAAIAAKSQGADKIVKSPPSYLPDLTHGGVNSSFYEFKCSDRNSNGVHQFESQYAEHFYEQPMVVFPPKFVSTEILEKSPFLPHSGTTFLKTIYD